jgi:hypothetical protein
LPEENKGLLERLQKAGAYFEEKLSKTLLPAARTIPILTDNKSVQKLALETLETLQKELFIKNACFASAQKGFSSAQYLRSKADAELDFRAAKISSTAPSSDPYSMPLSTPHPALFALLKTWREGVAEAANVERYQVMHTRTLLEIVQQLPANLSALKKIKGIGEAKTKQFGSEIVEIVQQYCVEHKIETTHISEILMEKPAKIDTKTLSFELFKSGKTIEEIARERGFVRGTIEGHLAHFVGLGALDIYTLLEPEKVQEIEQFFRERNTQSAAEAREHFGEKYTYGEYKMVLQYLNLEGTEA